MQNSIAPMKENLAVSTKCHIHLPFDPAIPLLEISPTETLAKIQKHTCSNLCISALLKIAKSWKQPKVSSLVGWWD